MSTLSAIEPACGRKTTHPCLITPPARPASVQVSPTGSRKLQAPPMVKPQLPTKQLKLKNVPPMVKNRDLLAELGLELSEDECMKEMEVLNPELVSEPTQTILINALVGPGHCSYLFVKGGKQGKLCGKKCRKGRNLCGVHASINKKVSQSVAGSDVISSSSSELKELKRKVSMLEETISKSETKIQRLEDMLTKSNEVPTSVNKKIKELEELVSKTNKVFGRKSKPKSIQTIRIYKLDPSSIYKLLRYKDGMPIMESRGILYRVIIPSYMSRPIPNGKWSLVANEEYPEMVWKEI